MNNVDRMLCISTAHVTPLTMKNIQDGAFFWLPSYRKKDEVNGETYGAFMYAGEGVSDYAEEATDVPEDLRNVIQYAAEMNVPWVMFDRDAEEEEDLPTYHTAWDGAIAFGRIYQYA